MKNVKLQLKLNEFKTTEKQQMKKIVMKIEKHGEKK